MEGKQLVASDGAIVCQINGLAVSQVGDHSFGHPSRVTARTYVGKQSIVQIDREVEMAGPIHNKGLMTLVGYLGGQYASDLPLSLSSQITFERNYGGIDGDSDERDEHALLDVAGESVVHALDDHIWIIGHRGFVPDIAAEARHVECSGNALA